MIGGGSLFGIVAQATPMALTAHLDEIEPTAMIVAGFVLFLFPEPATSVLGIGLMLLGGAWWVKEWDRFGVPGWP